MITRVAGVVAAIMVVAITVSSGKAAAAVGDITEYTVPTASSLPSGIVAGSDGNLWFTERQSNKVAAVTLSGAFTEYTVPTADSQPFRIAAGPDGNLWFTEVQANKVAKVSTSGVFTEYPVPSPSSAPYGITAGPDGNLWFTEYNANKVAKVTTSGAFTEYPIPTAGSGPTSITAGPDGNLWLTEASANVVANVTVGGNFTEFTLFPAGNYPDSITAGPDGNLWFIEGAALKVAKMATSGTVIVEYPVPTQAILDGIAAGPDGNLWITQEGHNTNDLVSSLTTSGVFTKYALAAQGNNLTRAAAGPDGNVWFLESSGNRVARVAAARSCTATAVANSKTALSTKQYSLANSDGVTWQDIDTSNLRLTCTTDWNQSTLLTANADLWTANAGYNQDLGIFVSDNGAADQLVAWKESGGSAGTFSPNAAYVQSIYNMAHGHTYVFKLKWKANKPAAGATIFAAAGAGPVFSPTSLVAQTFPTGVAPNFAASTNQYMLSNSDGVTWQSIDTAALSTTLAPTADATAVLGANADLWTANAGYNQDLGIFVSDNGAADQLVAWKESGGLAGTFSPNAAFLKATYAMTGGHTYVFTLKWKTNKNAAGATIFAAAGSGPIFSPTNLLAKIASSLFTAVSTSQYLLPNSDGVTWQPIDAGLNVTVTPNADANSVVGANADLWTANAGYNQDVGVFVSDNGGPDVLLAWKESGGFAGTFSPNAAFAQTTYLMTSTHTYVFTLKWKTNKNAAGATIYAAAGGPRPFSPTRLTVELTA